MKLICMHTPERDTLAIDIYDNEIYVENKNIYLSLHGENRSRLIAVIRKSNDDLFMSRNYEKHRLRKADAYGFNYEVLKRARIVKFISLRDDYHLYRIPISIILDLKNFLHFKQKGFEKQLFMTFEQMREFIIS